MASTIVHLLYCLDLLSSYSKFFPPGNRLWLDLFPGRRSSKDNYSPPAVLIKVVTNTHHPPSPWQAPTKLAEAKGGEGIFEPLISEGSEPLVPKRLTGCDGCSSIWH